MHGAGGTHRARRASSMLAISHRCPGLAVRPVDGRRFLLRIEDLDSSRVRPGLVEQQCAALAAGLTFDEEPVVQSARLPAYRTGAPGPGGPIVRISAAAARNRRGQLRRRTLRSVLTRTCRDLTPIERAAR